VKRAALFVACIACGHAGGAARPVVLANAPPHVPTTAERRADVCARSDLVALEGPVLASGSAVAEHGVVKSVSARDASGRDVDVGAQTLALLPRGVELDAAQAREVVRRLWTTGKYDDVAVETAREGEGIAVVFRVTPKRVIANVFVSGDADVVALHLTEGAVYDPVALVSARNALIGSLVREGHLDATVTVSSAFADADRRALDVCVRADRGPRVVLDAIVVRGTAYVSILEPIFADVHHGAALDDQVFERDLLLASAALYDRGLLEHKIGKTIERHGDELTVRLDVADGAVYRYSRIDVRGDLAAPKAAYAKLVTQKPGDVFDRSAMLHVMDAIRALDASSGHAGVEIEPETTLDEKAHTVALVLALKQPKR
jgi:outer membrane protein insertion porin family